MKMYISALAVAMAVIGTAASAAVTNGDFENGLTGWTITNTANGTTSVSDVVSFDTTGSGASNAARFNVGQVTFTQGVNAGITLSQTINVATAGTYSFAADIAAFVSVGGSTNEAGGLFELLVGNVVLDSVDLGRISSGSTLRGSLDMGSSLATGPIELGIRITRPFLTSPGVTPFQYVDNVTMTGPSVIPLPAAGIVLLTALGGAAVAYRRRKAA